MKIRIISKHHIFELEEEVNEWLKKYHSTVRDIKYSGADERGENSVMIIYD